MLLNGLSILEYRGYDSAGVGVVDITGNVVICKSKGAVKSLKDKVKSTLEYNDIEVADKVMGIAHTRWATHGPPSDENSHPHICDTSDMFVVVHNGIITNNKALRETLTNNGYRFQSQTDTEVIPKLCADVYTAMRHKSPTFKTVVENVVSQLEGTFALLITSKVFPSEIIVCRRGSPLLVGNDDKGMFTFASDASALVISTKVLVLEDNDLLHITKDTCVLSNVVNKKVVSDLKWSDNKVQLSDVDVGTYKSYMEKEIFEQPMSLYNTVSINTFLDHKQHMGFNINSLKPLVHRIENAKSIVLLACGTSYHSCVASRFIISKYCKKDVYVEMAGQFAEVETRVSPNNVYIFVSQSGETADALESLRYIKLSSSALCIGITNKPESAIARECDCSIDLNAGIEISVASTKAYTSQLTMFVIFSICLYIDIVGPFDGLDIHELQMSTIRVPESVKNALMMSDDVVKRVAEEVKDFRSMLFIGRGSDYATALESALKVKEISYIHSEGILASELKHGPLAMIDDNVCLFVFATQNQFYMKMISVIEQLKARKGKLYVICNEDDNQIAGIVKDETKLIRVPKTHETVQHIINIVPMQLLAYYLATAKGYNVDKPRNLAKSVTVSD
jgi:glucosamine--fructose-6-phosphate aminotransferase (isomerizing)